MVDVSSTEKRQHEEGVATPAGGRLHLAAAGEPALGPVVVAPLDGERGQPVVAREQELGLAHVLGGGQRLPIAGGAPLVVAPALVDLSQDDEGNGQVTALAQPAVE